MNNKCKEDDCGKPVVAKQLCSMHYGRLRRHGNTSTVKTREYTTPTEKMCAYCKSTKPLSEFYFRTEFSYTSRCKLCIKRWKVARQYSLTLEEYDLLLVASGGICNICEKPQESLSVDHDHKCCAIKARSCGKCIRGLICSSCNFILGLAKDDPQILQKSIVYLAKYNPRPEVETEG